MALAQPERPILRRAQKEVSVALDPMAETANRDAVDIGCAHWWQIESPNGENSQGMCKHCGAIRSFANSSQTRTMTRSVRPQPRVSAA